MTRRMISSTTVLKMRKISRELIKTISSNISFRTEISQEDSLERREETPTPTFLRNPKRQRKRMS
jgi:hypothetical protein